ncbi:MAG: 2-oxoglutarate and iron-dependent oxygenase domain-containing protein [Woeseiaceae bacterium]|nr:2-oxoglutarate and iron-dependent oxygenase domain-containing protein [Woeseiaceae bacterium]
MTLPAAERPAEIRVVDLAGPDATRCIELACRDIGFMFVRGHGIAPQTVAAARAALVEYFSLPLETKLAHAITRDNYRGYIPLGFFKPNTGGGAADHYEGYKLHFEVAADDPIRASCDLYGPNRWPAELPGFRRAIEAYRAECDRVAEDLIHRFATILGVDEQRFLGWFEQPLTNMTLLHYPARPAGAPGFGIHPHKDTDVFTILAADPAGGLMVRRRDDRNWLAADPPPDALVVNIGDMLELWSGGYLVSTPHKVENPPGKARYSFPYFVVPRHDTVVEPLMPPQPGFSRAPVHVGDVSREVWRTNWQDAPPAAAGFDLGTLDD